MDAGARETVDHAQRVAEGVSLEIHRNTWRYNKLIEIQRQAVLEQRDRVLRTDAALRALARQSPDRALALAPTVPDEVLVDAARQITLWHLDRAWADHLSYLADLREGIHLRALGHGLNPLTNSTKRPFAPSPDCWQRSRNSRSRASTPSPSPPTGPTSPQPT